MSAGIYPRINPIDAFLGKFKAGNGCWLWQRHIVFGYGILKVNGTNMPAHRFSYQLFKGCIPKGMMVLHQCDVRRCVRPSHLQIGTHKENMHQMAERNRVAWGDRQSSVKLTEGEVGEIRLHHSSGGISIYRLAQIYECSECAVTGIVKNKTWLRILNPSPFSLNTEGE